MCVCAVYVCHIKYMFEYTITFVQFCKCSALLSSGGNFVKVWDTVAGGRLLANLENHHKTVTSLCYSSSYQRLVSASLDR